MASGPRFTERSGAGLFLILFALSFWRNTSYRSAVESRRVDLPLSSVCGAVWDEKAGLALLGLCGYSRVQAYDGKGRFQYGWTIPGSGAAFRIAEAAPGLIRASITRGFGDHYYDSAGHEVAPRAQPEITSTSITRLRIRNGLFRSVVAIVRRGVTVGQVQTASRDVLSHEPLPELLYLGAAILLYQRPIARWRQRSVIERRVAS